MQKVEQLHIWGENKNPKLSDMLALEAICSAETFTARRKINNRYFCAECYKEINIKDKICPHCHKIIIEEF